MQTRLLLLPIIALFAGACSFGVPIGDRGQAASAGKSTPKKSKQGNPSSYVVHGKQYYVLDSAEGFVQRGIASWYGIKFHGRRTSSGEIYNMHEMTAAHKSLPLPSYVHVRNLDNGRTAVVRVNDRGPFIPGRIIDLSYSAARKLDMVREGTSLVEVEAISFDAPAGDRVVRQTTPAPPAAVITGKKLIGWNPVFARASAGPSLRQLLAARRTIRAEAAWLEARSPDIVHLNSATLWTTALGAKRADLPLVWHVRETLYGGRFSLRKRLYGRFIRRTADAVIAISPTDAASLDSVTDVHEIDGAVRFLIREGATPQDLFRQLADSGAHVERFAVQAPSLDEIFIRTVDGDPRAESVR